MSRLDRELPCDVAWSVRGRPSRRDPFHVTSRDDSTSYNHPFIHLVREHVHESHTRNSVVRTELQNVVVLGDLVRCIWPYRRLGQTRTVLWGQDFMVVFESNFVSHDYPSHV